ncbi:MAG: hypothetical protein ACOC1I_00115 [Spirochaetota bacterium]
MRNTAPTLALLLAATFVSVTGAGASEADDEARRVALERATRYSPDYTTPVLRENEDPVAIFGDLNGDDLTDVAVLTVVRDERISARAAVLSDPLRRYSRNAVDPIYILEAYYTGQEAIVTVELGRRTVWSDMRLVPLAPGHANVAVEVRFRDATGEASELVVFQGGSVSRISLTTNRNEYGEIVDITGDGVLDIFTVRRSPEAGRGYESFLELRELTAYGYRRTKTLALVRAANVFLETAEERIERNEWDALASLLETSGEAGKSPDYAVVFPPAADEPPEDGPEEEPATPRFDYHEARRTPIEVTFPRLIDNPFPAPYRGARFRLVFRVECCEHLPRFYEAWIGLAANPFDEAPFAFLTEPGGRQ